MRLYTLSKELKFSLTLDDCEHWSHFIHSATTKRKLKIKNKTVVLGKKISMC